MKIIIQILSLSLLLTCSTFPQWILQNSGTNERLLTCYFLNSNVGWVAGYNGMILKTTNGGDDWNLISINTTDNIHSIFFLDSLKGWAALYEYNPMRHGSIIHTTDGGNNWITQYIINDVVLHDVFFTDMENGYFVGSSSALFKTTNGGQFWFDISPTTGFWFYSTYFFNKDVGWVGGGLEGFLLRTTNGGQNWSFINIPVTERIMSIYFLDNNYGWACGEDGKIIRSTNAGLDWLQGASGASVELRDIQFIDQNEGWAVGLNGKIIHSIDGGSNWFLQNSGSNFNFYAVHFEDALTGWTVGDNGTILFTNNGGIPVELVSFTGQLENDLVNLSWITATEMNNFGFEIERKTKDDWVKIGFVDGIGTTTEMQYYSFTDNIRLIINVDKIYYRLKQIDFNGTYEYSNEVTIEISQPNSYLLKQNYPNPFNPGTSIQYAVSSRQFVSLKVYDVLGNEVASLVSEEKPAGNFEVVFNAASLSSGIYYYKLVAGDFVDVKKMLLLK